VSDAPVERLSLEQINGIFTVSPFIAFLGIRGTALDYDKSEFSATMPLRPEVERRKGTGQFHGGPLASFIDVVGDFAIGMLVGGGVPTINLRIDYLRPATGSLLSGTAKVRRAGKTVAVVDIDVFDDQNRLVAIGRGTYSGTKG
jgi:uncharacterized protein (TIGR00369 family)